MLHVAPPTCDYSFCWVNKVSFFSVSGIFTYFKKKCEYSSVPWEVMRWNTTPSTILTWKHNSCSMINLLSCKTSQIRIVEYSIYSQIFVHFTRRANKNPRLKMLLQVAWMTVIFASVLVPKQYLKAPIQRFSILKETSDESSDVNRVVMVL